MRRVGGHPAFAWAGRHIAFPVERAVWQRFGSTIRTGVPELLLVTTGRRTGQPRSVPVVYLNHNSALVVVASNWGGESHPAWSENLLANPEAEVVVGRRRIPVMARLPSHEEKRELWPRLLEIWPGWRAYMERTPRQFRVFILEPTEERRSS